MLTSATTTDLTSQCEGGGGGGGTISPPFHPFRCCTVGQTEAKRKCANRYAEHFRDGTSEHRIQQLQSADCHCQPDGERTLWQDTVVRLHGRNPDLTCVNIVCESACIMHNSLYSVQCLRIPKGGKNKRCKEHRRPDTAKSLENHKLK